MASTMNRVAYFVPIKGKEGMAVGPVSEDQLKTLIGVLEDAHSQKKGIVFFLFRNEPDPEQGRKSIATLTVAVERDRPQGNYRKPIGSVPKSEGPAKPNPLVGLFGNEKQAERQETKKGW